MQISDLLSPEGVLPSLKVKDKKQLLQQLADKASQITRVPQ